MKIYENANDQHVRKVVLYEVGAGLAFDKAGTDLLTKEEIVDAFLKGCVVENEGNYKTPTGVNVTDSGAELVFGGGSSGGGMVVHFVVDLEDHSLTCDHTVEEVKTALKTAPVSAYITVGDEGGYLSCGSVQQHERLPEGAIVFYTLIFNDSDYIGSVHIQIYETEDGTWSNEPFVYERPQPVYA